MNDVLATEVSTADSALARALGFMFNRSIGEAEALVFRFGDVGRRDVHMLFVPFGLDVLFVVDGEVERVETLPAWLGFASAEADTVIELPAGSAAGVWEGDRVEVDEEVRVA